MGKILKKRIETNCNIKQRDIDNVQAAIHAYNTRQSSELTRYHQRTGALTKESYKNAIGYLLDVFP